MTQQPEEYSETNTKQINKNWVTNKWQDMGIGMS